MSLARELADIMKRLDWCEAQAAKLPTRMSQNVGGGGAGGPAEGTYVPLVRADSPEELDPDAAPYSMGYIEAGEYIGAWFTMMGGEWVGLNVWRPPVEE